MKETVAASEGLEQLLRLEEKIHQTAGLLKSARGEKQELSRENTRLRLEREERDKTIRSLEERLRHLEMERETVRKRVERLVEQVDALTNAEPEA
jgi:regulator of replication initiation timing